MISLFLFSCLTKTIDVGFVDLVEPNICTVQLPDESIITIDSEICSFLKEGDVIQVERIK